MVGFACDDTRPVRDDNVQWTGACHSARPLFIRLQLRGNVLMGSTATQRPEVAISSTEYDLAVARDLAERLIGRLLASSRNAIYIGATADASPARAKDDANAWAKARIVVVLHDRLWGKTPATAAAAIALAARKSKATAKSVKVIRLDDSPLPSVLRGADARQIAQGLEAITDWVATAIASAGGSLRKARASAKATAATDADNKRAEVAATFLGSSRAVAVCAREFERLADNIAKRAATVGEKTGTRAEVQRMPDRCIVQMGPVALSVSWVRERVDTVATGRLMIAEWQGTVVRASQRPPEMQTKSVPHGPATLMRENILRADATGEPDWLWRHESTTDRGFASRDLAAQCVDSLVLSLQETATISS